MMKLGRGVGRIFKLPSEGCEQLKASEMFTISVILDETQIWNDKLQ